MTAIAQQVDDHRTMALLRHTAHPMSRAEVAEALLRYLDSELEAFCVLGNGEMLPQEIPSDIDIVVPRRAAPALPRLLSAFCRRHRLTLVQVRRHEASARRFDIAWFGENGTPCFLAPDICTDYQLGGRLYLRAEALLAGLVRARWPDGAAKSFFVPAPATAFVAYLIKKVEKQDLSEKAAAYLSGLWRADPAGARAALARFYRDSDVTLLARAAEDNEWDAVRAALPQLRRTLHARVRRRPIDLWRELERRLDRLTQPTGLDVAVLGPDGCGKSTVIQRLVKDCAAVFHGTEQYHLRPAGARRPKPSDAPITNPHGAMPRRALGSTLKLLYNLILYTSGHLARIRPALVRSTLIVFDRYFHDILVDPRRYRYGGPMWLVRLVARFIPKPDLWLLLDAPADVLQARKQEVTHAESERQRIAYRALFATLDDSRIIDASKAIEAVTADAEAALLAHLAKRTARRLGLEP